MEKKNKIPDDYTRWGTFEELGEITFNQQYSIIKNILKKKNLNKSEQNLKNFWVSGMDTEKLNNKNIEPLENLINLILELKEKRDIVSICGNLHNYGIPIFYSIVASQDAKNPEIIIPHIYASGLNLPDKDYYLLSEHKKIKNKYELFLVNICKYLKNKNINLFNNLDDIKNLVKDVVNFETQLAKLTLSNTEMRNPNKIYNIQNKKTLKSLGECFNWDIYLNNANINLNCKLNLDQHEFAKGVDKLLTSSKFDVIKLYIIIRNFIGFMPYLCEETDNLYFDFYGKILGGQIKQKKREKRMIHWVNDSIGEILGKKYIETFFSENAKKKAKSLVNDIFIVFNKRLDELEWMGDLTKKRAKKKLKNINVKIGYPDKWRNYNSLILKNDEFINNILMCNKFDWKYELSQMNKPVNRDNWEMLPQQVNAYYHPEMNEIVFPAAILQYPFFSEEAIDPINYGGIGCIIGHELTHGFDDQGRKYNSDGKLVDWWEEKDKKLFNKLAKKIINQFNNCSVYGKNINGELTQGENIADLGGLTIGLEALRENFERNNINLNEKFVSGSNPQFSYKQLFFISWGQVWKMNIRKETRLTRLLTDPHSPEELRICEPLKNMDDFIDCFEIKKGDKMFKDLNQRIKIW